jgi:CHAT domain-containing protein
VQDHSTAELMDRFYRRLLRDGLRPAAALRAAQLAMLDEPP